MVAVIFLTKNYLKFFDTNKVYVMTIEAGADSRASESYNLDLAKKRANEVYTYIKKINPDLDAYVTQLAIQGLFKLVEKEENKIRKDPGARVTDILMKVFSSI